MGHMWGIDCEECFDSLAGISNHLPDEEELVGNMIIAYKSDKRYAWPVRSGQTGTFGAVIIQ